MLVTLKAFATLRNHLPAGEHQYNHEGLLTVRELLMAHGIPPAETAIILVNGLHSSLEKELCDGDTVSVFPAVGGG